MKTVAEARTMIFSQAARIAPERVKLVDALHRVLREEALADTDQPPFDCSAMDGYALASEDRNEWLEITAEIQAGSPNQIELQPGQCARIFTGARIPAGADRVLKQEDAKVKDGFLRTPPPDTPDHIRRQGENRRRGEIMVAAGQRLRPVDLATLASCGVTNPLVSRRPRVVHFVTGDELIDPSLVPTGTQIRDSNSILISSLIAESRAQLEHQSRLPDNLQEATKALSEHGDFDLLLISGGASVGDYDFARPLLEAAGFTVLFHGINLRPGKPLLFAKRGRQLAFGLPGNPVSHAVIFRLLIAPLLAVMEGVAPCDDLLDGLIDGDFPASSNFRESYWPCFTVWQDGAYRLRPVQVRSSGDIAGASAANALIRIASQQVPKLGDRAEFLWL